MNNRKGAKYICAGALFVVLAIFLASCGPLWGAPYTTLVASLTALPGTSTFTPFQPMNETPSPTAFPSPSPSLIPSLWISPAVPEALRQVALTKGLPLAESPQGATARLDLLGAQSGDVSSTVWIYALVAPFPSLVDSVSSADLRAAWGGAAAGPLAGRPLWMAESTLQAFTALWGVPAAGAVSVAEADQLLDAAWGAVPAWAIVPFESLEPRWKVLAVDGQSPIRNDFDAAAYPLKVTFSLQPSVFSLPVANRDPSKLTVVAMTGVTALTRGTADRMERYGVLYPGEEARNVLRAADIAHVSNEVSFLEDCPPPDPYTSSMRFCSAPSYIALLEDIGVDVIELTGNHLLDYGPQPFLETLDFYEERGWSYFGGGRTLEEARRPALLVHHANQLAFLGCNYAGPPNDWAAEGTPGSLPCDLDWMAAEVTRLRQEGYLPIVTFQYDEYEQLFPTNTEREVFRRMAKAGAVIVSGSQAHVPRAMEFAGEAFIHYGLGNLFFDQNWGYTPKDFVDLHVFYAGRYISTELLTFFVENLARPRPMTEAERRELLEDIFEASGW